MTNWAIPVALSPAVAPATTAAQAPSSMASPQAPSSSTSSVPRGLLYTGPSRYSWHRIESFMRCPQLYSYQHVLRLFGLDAIEGAPEMEEDTTALTRGTLGHQGLAQHYQRLRDKQEGRDPDRWLLPADAIRTKAAIEGGAWLDHATVAVPTVEAYLRGTTRERLRVLGVEMELIASLRAGDAVAPHTQKADLVLVGEDDRVYIWDHKFCARIWPNVLERYAVSGQFLGYEILGRRIWGDRWGGVRLNLVAWADRDGRVKWERKALPPAPWALRAWEGEVVAAWQAIGLFLDTGLDPWRWRKKLSEYVCKGPYKSCLGQSFCQEGPAAGEAAKLAASLAIEAARERYAAAMADARTWASLAAVHGGAAAWTAENFPGTARKVSTAP